MGDETAHAFIGHGAYLQQYQRRTLEEKIELWNELEPEVLVFDQSKNIEKIRKLKDANIKFEDQQKQIDEMKKEQEHQSKILRMIEKYQS